MISTDHLEKRVERLEERLESDSHTEGERPPELTKEEKLMLNEEFDRDPWESESE